MDKAMSRLDWYTRRALGHSLCERPICDECVDSYTVIVCNGGQADLARRLLPATDCIAQGGGRIYFLYTSKSSREQYAYSWGDGEPIIAIVTLDTSAKAKAWVRADMRGRHG
jgi:hypothetical protein